MGEGAVKNWGSLCAGGQACSPRRAPGWLGTVWGSHTPLTTRSLGWGHPRDPLALTKSPSTEPWGGGGTAQGSARVKGKGAGCGQKPCGSASPVAQEGEPLSLGFLSRANRRVFPAEEEKELAKERGQGG